MSKPTISVIIPIYNAEKYLSRCIDSILCQSFRDFEILLIDDGSQDESDKICDEYARRDKRIEVFHKENGGVSSARNFGLDKSCGEWITFVDADDELAPVFLSNMVSCAHGKAVLIISNCVVNVENERHCSHVVINNEVISGDELLDRLLKGENIRNEVWAKLFKRSYIDKVRFNTNLKIGEDLLFLLSCCKNHLKEEICFSSHSDYLYYQYESSVMGKKVNRSGEYENLISSTLSLMNESGRNEAKARFVINQVWVILDRYNFKKFKMPKKYDHLIAEYLPNAGLMGDRKVVLSIYLKNKLLGFLSYIIYKIKNKAVR